MPDTTLSQLNPRTLTPALNPLLVVDGAGLEKVQTYLSRVSEYAIDLETNVVDRFFNRRIRTIQLGDRNEQFVIDLLAFAETPERLYKAQGSYRGMLGHPDAQQWNLDPLARHYGALLSPVVDVLRPSLEARSHLKVGANLEFEYTNLKWCLGLRSWHFYCTQIAERMITNGLVNAMQAGVFGLADLVRKYLRVEVSKELQTTFDLETPLTEEQVIYCALDCRLPFAVRANQLKMINADGLARSVQIEMDCIPAFGDLHLNGMLVSKDLWMENIKADEQELVKAIARMDSFFLPVVGRKTPLSTEDEVQALRATWEALKVPSEAEADLSKAIRLCGKDPERKAVLMLSRDELQARRAVKLKRAKEEYTAAKSTSTKKAREEFESFEGEAAINYNSPAQLLKALHEGKFGLNEKNFPATDDRSLEKNSSRPVVAAIRDYRKYKKKLGTYGYRWVTSREEVDPNTKKNGFVDPDTGRIHARFLQLGADTGRPSCTKPNLLNLPREDRVRAAFVSRPGYDIVTKDCAGQELRILTEYAKEPSWIEAFQNKQDLHSISAEMLAPQAWRQAAILEEKRFNVMGKEKVIPPCAYYTRDKKKCACPDHKDERDKMKNINFGVAYDKQKYSTAIELGIEVEEADELLKNWHSTFAVTSATLKYLRDSAYEKGEARTLSGRRRLSTKVSYEQAKVTAARRAQEKGYACDQNRITQTYQSLVAGVKRELGNFPIQGGGADLVKQSMGCGFDPEGKPYLWHILEPQYGALLLNYVYDELVTESPEQHSEEVSEAVSDAIIRAGAEFVKVVPMESEGSIAKRWKK